MFKPVSGKLFAFSQQRNYERNIKGRENDRPDSDEQKNEDLNERTSH